MAEESAVRDLERLVQRLQALFSHYSSDTLRAQSEPFCSEFSTLVEEHASRWQVPLPQLRILEIALCYFAQASTFLPSNCDHVIRTLSSLALSVFELLLFFDQKDFNQEPLKQFTVTFQECHSALTKHQNVHLLQVERLLQGGGMWAYPALRAILSDSSLPQNEVDGFITSEPSIFLELRVRYLLSCKRVREAMALSRCCARHPTVGRHLFFLQVYLTSLYKISQHERLHAEVAGFNGNDAVNIICSLECEENDELLLWLSRVFLSELLRRGDVHQLCDLVLVWTKLHKRLKTSKPPFLEESRQLMLSATNICSIFPFIRAILQEVGEDGIQFCVELCANALQSFPASDTTTKSHIYKTIAALVPNDLEVCRACALLLFFLERSVESYKTVYLLYMLPDQEYHVDCSSIGNQVRFETLQILKKDLYFDPEFWNLIALRTNCLKLMREKGVSTALDEIMEDKWIAKYCTKDTALRQTCKGRKEAPKAAAQKRPNKVEVINPPKRFKAGLGRPRINVDYTGKKKGNQRSKLLRDSSSAQLRRSFWQLDRIQEREHGRITRLSEKGSKRRIRQPRWLLEDAGILEENRFKKHGLRCRNNHQSSLLKRQECVTLENDIKHKTSLDSDLKAKKMANAKYKRASVESQRDRTPQVILELSLPDNELLGTFTDEFCHRSRGLPQVLLYKPTEKLPDSPQTVRTAHRKEVIIRARDLNMFVQQLHCYIRRPKGKDPASHVHGSGSTITRSSVQGTPSQYVAKTKAPRQKSTVQLRGKVAPQTTADIPDAEILQIKGGESASESISSVVELPDKSVETQASSVLKAVASDGETFEEPAVEMKVTIASPILDKVSNAEVSHSSIADVNPRQADDKFPPTCDQINAASDAVPSPSQRVSPERGEEETNLVLDEVKNDQTFGEVSHFVSGDVDVNISPKDPIPDASIRPEDPSDLGDLPSLTAEIKVVKELAQQQPSWDPENVEQRFLGNGAFKDPIGKGKPEPPLNEQSTSTCEASQSNVKQNERKERDVGADPLEDQDLMEDQPESEESKLEFCCTFCNKDFKGCFVVKHAMVHYRRDECMFCGTMFKDDLLAMMHLSNHIEKLKKILKKEDVGNDAKGKSLSQTKEPPTSETLVSSQCKRKRGRPRKRPLVGPLMISESRKLRSSMVEDGSSSQEQSSHTIIPKLNGHFGKKKEAKRLRGGSRVRETLATPESHDESINPRLVTHQCSAMDSSAPLHQVDKQLVGLVEEKKKTIKAPQEVETCAKQNRNLNEKRDASKEKVSCPMDGCSWFTDPSKNCKALLYHALEEHSGEMEPLELAFRIGESRCSICLRVLRSFEHFQHHVERHRQTPRHPCLHQGCIARFKTGIEMRRHTRKHSPLQAVCCLPGCPKLFICLWALNLHEREHYSPKLSKTNKKLLLKKCNKSDSAVQNQTVENFKDPSNEPKTEKAECHQNEPTTHASPRVKHVKVLSSSANKNKTGISKIHRPNSRLRKTLRSLTNDALPNVPNTMVSSSLFLRSRRAKQKLKKKQQQPKANTNVPKKRGRPRKIISDVHVTDALLKDQKNHVQLPPTDPVYRSTAEKCEHIQKQTAEIQQSNLKTKKPAGQKDKSSQDKEKKKKKKKKSSADRLFNNNSDTETKKVKAGHLTPRSSVSGSLKLANDKVKTKIKKHQPSLQSDKSNTTEGKGRASRNEELTENISSVPTHSTSAHVTSKNHRSKGSDKKGEKIERSDVKEQLEENGEVSLNTAVQRKEEEGQTPACETADAAASDVVNAKTESTPNCLKTAKQNKSGKSKNMKPSDPSKGKKKHKDGPKEERKIKKLPQNSVDLKAIMKPTQSNPQSQAQAISEDKLEAAESSTIVPEPVTVTGDAVAENDDALGNAKPSLCLDVLEKYSKNPYIRLPPTAYLDERYTTMPKRRKKVPWFSTVPKREPPGQPRPSPALQRQRCANCFVNFTSTEELQSHLQTQRCSKLFGFDSDED